MAQNKNQEHIIDDRVEDITIDEVRTINTFKDWSEERILELIGTIKTLSEIMYHKRSTQTENGKIIVLDINKTNIAA